jgi:hypothetical protein
MALARAYLYSKHVFSLLFDDSSTSHTSDDAWQLQMISCTRLMRGSRAAADADEAPRRHQQAAQPSPGAVRTLHSTPPISDSKRRMIDVRDAASALANIAQTSALRWCAVPIAAEESNAAVDSVIRCAHALTAAIGVRSARATQALLDGGSAARVIYRYWVGVQSYVAYFDLPGDVFYFPLDLALHNIWETAKREQEERGTDEEDADEHVAEDGCRMRARPPPGCSSDPVAGPTSSSSLSSPAAPAVVQKNERTIGAEVCQVMDFIPLADAILTATLTIGPFELCMTEEVRQLAGPRGDFHGKKWSPCGVDMTVAIDLLAVRERALPIWPMIYKKGATMAVQTGDGEVTELRDADGMHGAWKETTSL